MRLFLTAQEFILEFEEPIGIVRHCGWEYHLERHDSFSLPSWLHRSVPT